jgi:hypothetical protein
MVLHQQMVILDKRFAFGLDLSHGLLLRLVYQDNCTIMAHFW